jgi:hypothetical protein
VILVGAEKTRIPKEMQREKDYAHTVSDGSGVSLGK